MSLIELQTGWDERRVWRRGEAAVSPVSLSKPALQIPTLSAHLSIYLSICRPEVEFIIWGDGGLPPRDERAELERQGPLYHRQ